MRRAVYVIAVLSTAMNVAAQTCYTTVSVCGACNMSYYQCGTGDPGTGGPYFDPFRLPISSLISATCNGGNNACVTNNSCTPPTIECYVTSATFVGPDCNT